MKKLLFVCHGNICRSPMAEFIMKDLVKRAGLEKDFHIESAATSTEEIGNPVYPPARRKLAEHGISCAGKTARQMSSRDYQRYDLLIGMDRANLPYYITTPIIMGLFEADVPLDSITVMVQKEVADRMKSGPGSKDYGALSLAVQYYSEPELAANVPPNCFIPRPNVGSAVICLHRHTKPPVEVKDEKLMFRLIRASFNQRRKTMLNSLNNPPELSFGKEQIGAALESIGLKSNIRGEALTLEQFAALSNAFGTIQ